MQKPKKPADDSDSLLKKSPKKQGDSVIEKSPKQGKLLIEEKKVMSAEEDVDDLDIEEEKAAGEVKVPRSGLADNQVKKIQKEAPKGATTASEESQPLAIK